MHRSLNNPVIYNIFFLGNFLPKDYWILNKNYSFCDLYEFCVCIENNGYYN